MDKHIIIFTIFFMFFVVGIIGDGNKKLRETKFLNCIKCYRALYNAEIIKGINEPAPGCYNFDGIMKAFYESNTKESYEYDPAVTEQWHLVMKQNNENFETDVLFENYLNKFAENYFSISPSENIEALISELGEEKNIQGMFLRAYKDQDEKPTPKEFCESFMNKNIPVQTDQTASTS